jgi:calcineurin-like phosphoesterase family protein
VTVWLSADLHLGHRLVAELRGFGDDVAAHDQAVLDNWDRVVSGADQVWVLGDLAVSNPAQALMELRGLPGVKHLVTGNHDPASPIHRDSHKWQRRYLDVFESVQAYARRRYNGRGVLLSHYPYTTDRGFEARYPQWRLPDLGEFLLHGHTHSKERVTSPREVHVGLDAWSLEPVMLDEAMNLFDWTMAE